MAPLSPQMAAPVKTAHYSIREGYLTWTQILSQESRKMMTQQLKVSLIMHCYLNGCNAEEALRAYRTNRGTRHGPCVSETVWRLVSKFESTWELGSWIDHVRAVHQRL